LRQGRVLVAGVPATNPAARVQAEDVRIQGEPVECPGGLLAVFHKPPGCVCSHETNEGPTIYDRLPARWLKRNPSVTSIGRLDKDATGLLLLTDIGELVHRWTSPKNKVPKLYEVTVDTDLRPGLVERFAEGTLWLDGESEPCLPARLEVLAPREARLELTEGRYHQVKRMFASQGSTVVRLHRTRFGPFELGALPSGEWQFVDPSAHH
jgi:16S rRNA pseudouridine516 synthase